MGSLSLNGSTEIADEEALGLGRLMRAFHNLEFLLRAFLYEREARPHGTTIDPHLDFVYAPVGTAVPETPMTDYDSLARLINRYHALVAGRYDNFGIDADVVLIRDALAHGRVISEENENVEIVKFGRPVNGRVNVEFRIHATPDNLRHLGLHVQNQALTVFEACGHVPKGAQ